MNETTNNKFLSAEEQITLQTFVDSADDDAAYLVRARLLLLHNSGTPPEIAASQIGITIHRARSFIRAFNRERLALFPADLFNSQSPQE